MAVNIALIPKTAYKGFILIKILKSAKNVQIQIVINVNK